MNERIKKVRKSLELTQQEFAERIGMKRNSIALIENGRNTSDQTVFAICREFNVNEEWLRTGAGEMFKAAPSSALDALAEEYGLSESAYVMVEKFINLKPDAQEAIFDYVLAVAAVFKEKPIAIPETSVSNLEKLTIDERVELFRMELEREERAGEKLQALPKNA
jgi:transcriptional regulator with XRE-family HTH domain